MQTEIRSNETPGRLGYVFGSACFVSAWAVVPLWYLFVGGERERVPFFGFCVIAAAGILGAWLFRRAFHMATDVSGNGRACLRLTKPPASGGDLDGCVMLDRVPYNPGLIRFEFLCLRGSNFKGNADWNYTRLWSGAGTAVVRRTRNGGEAAFRMPIPPGLPATQTLDSISLTSEIEFLWLLVIAAGAGGRMMTRSFNVPVAASGAQSRDELLALPEGIFYDVLVPRLTSDRVEGNGMKAVAVLALILIIASLLSAMHTHKLRRAAVKSAAATETACESGVVTFRLPTRHAQLPEIKPAAWQNIQPSA